MNISASPPIRPIKVGSRWAPTAVSTGAVFDSGTKKGNEVNHQTKLRGIQGRNNLTAAFPLLLVVLVPLLTLANIKVVITV